MCYEEITGRKIDHKLLVDSRSLYDSISTKHDMKEFRLRQAVESLRTSFELGEFATLRWIAGKANPADAITKRNPSTGPLLSEMCVTGRLVVNFHHGLTK